MAEEQIGRWRLTLDPYYTSAASPGATVDVDNDYITVAATQGSGYMRQDITTDIPLDVLFRLLQHAGYTVTHSAPADGVIPE